MAGKLVEKQYGAHLRGEVLVSRTVSKIISMMIDDLCIRTEKNIKKYRIKSVENVRRNKTVIADFSPKMKEMVANLRRFLFDHFYMNRKVMLSVEEGKRMIKKVFAFYYKNPQKLPGQKNINQETLHIIVKDYVAGMTDSFLIEEYKKHIMKKKK
jgi:dGTPase